MSFEKIAEKLMKLLENTEEIRIDKFELIGEKLEFQILPGMAMTAALGAKRVVKGLAAGVGMSPTEWIETKFPEISDTGQWLLGPHPSFHTIGPICKCNAVE